MTQYTNTVSPTLKSGLQFLGLWPGMQYAVAYRLLYMWSLLTMQYFQYQFIFAHCKPDEIEVLVEALPMAIDYSLTVTKLFILWSKCRVINELLAAIDTDWRECLNVDQYLQAMTPKASISHIYSKALVTFNAIVGVVYLLSDYTMSMLDQAESGNDTSRILPVQMLFPFDAEQSPIYELLFIILFVHVLTVMYVFVTLNILSFTLVLHIAGQIDIICQGFKNVSEKTQTCKSSEDTIGMLIKRHNKVITFSENIDKLFSLPVLMEIFWNTVVICCLGLFVVSSIHNNDTTSLMRGIFGYAVVMMDIFMYSIAGEYLNIKNKSLNNAVYESLWYNMSPKYGKNILFIIMRSQKEMSISAGGMTNLSMETFAAVMKTSASYVSVLYAMY